MNKSDLLRNVCSRFQIAGNYDSSAARGIGRINDTYLAVHENNGTLTRQIVQRINRHVFPEPIKLMENFQRVSGHILAKLVKTEATELERRHLSLFRTDNGNPYFIDEAGDYWRVFNFIEGATAHDFATDPRYTFEAAKAFGLFQLQLSDLESNSLHEIIPGFHNTQERFTNFETAIRQDIESRVKQVEPEIEFALSNKKIASTLEDRKKAGDLRQRVVHNDTKINNIMIDDQTMEGICVIDLDTIGPGLPHYDFGDLVRTVCCTSAEGDKDLAKVGVRMDMFEAAAKGYLIFARDFLNQVEIESLAISGKVIAFELGLRFLTDFLQGDRYFKTKKPFENLHNCRSQFKLVESLETHEDKMYSFIKNL